MKKTIFLLLTIASLLTHPFSTRANDSATASGNQEQTITENLKKRLKNTLKSAQQNLITDTEIKPKAFVGQVKDIIQQTVNIATKDDQRYAALTEETTIIRSPGNTLIKPENIRIDDFIIAMGYPQPDNPTTLTAKRVIVSQKLTLDLAKTSGLGQITKLTSTSLTLKNPQTQEETTLSLTRQTVVKNKEKILSLTDLEEEQTIIYTADTHPTPTATIIMIVD